MSLYEDGLKPALERIVSSASDSGHVAANDQTKEEQ